MRYRVIVLLLIVLGLCLQPAFAKPRPVTSAEKAACEIVADFLGRGPAAIYDALSADAPLRKLSRADAIAEIEARTGPASAATWTLCTASKGFAEHGAIFRVVYPSMLDDAITFDFTRQQGQWKIRSIRSMAETVTRPEPAKNQPSDPNAVDWLLVFAFVAPLLAILGVVVRRYAPLVGSFCLTFALVAFCFELAVTADPALFRHARERLSEAPSPMPFAQLRDLVRYRRALATGTDRPKVRDNDQEVKETAALWAADADLVTERPEKVGSTLADLTLLGSTPLAQLIRARIAASAGSPDAEALYDKTYGPEGRHDGFWDEQLRLGNDSAKKNRIIQWRSTDSRDAAIYYISSMEEILADRRDIARGEFADGWRMQPMPRSMIVSAAVYAGLLRDPAIATLVNLRSPDEWRPPDFEIGRDPMKVRDGATPLASGLFLSITVNDATLEIPGGGPIAPPQTKVVDATEWERREEAAALADVRQLAGVVATGVPMRQRLDRAVAALADHNRWSEILTLTDWIRPDSVQISEGTLVYRTEALVRARRFDEARDLAMGSAVKNAMLRTPNPGTIIRLAESMTTASEFATAIELYKSVVGMDHAPDVSQRLRQLELRQSIASSGRSIKTQHFDIRCTSDVGETTARKISETLESELARISPIVGLREFQPVRVNVLGWANFSRQLTQSEDIVGFYDGDITVPFASVSIFGPEATSILTHELTHAIVAKASGDTAPHWFQEGVAQRMEEGVSKPNIFQTKTPDQILALSLLDATLDGSIDPEAIEESYSVAHTLIRYLESRYGSHVVNDLIAAYRAGANTDDAFRKVTGKGTSEIDRDLRAWGQTNQATFGTAAPTPATPAAPPIDPRVIEGIRFSKDAKKP